jgi:hypothetical protein
MLATTPGQAAPRSATRRIVKPAGLVNAAPQIDREPPTARQPHSLMYVDAID